MPLPKLTESAVRRAASMVLLPGEQRFCWFRSPTFGMLVLGDDAGSFVETRRRMAAVDAEVFGHVMARRRDLHPYPELLIGRQDQSAPVRLIFQQAEETGVGVTAMIAAEVLVDVDLSFGAHLDRHDPAGAAVVTEGARLSCKTSGGSSFRYCLNSIFAIRSQISPY